MKYLSVCSGIEAATREENMNAIKQAFFLLLILCASVFILNFIGHDNPIIRSLSLFFIGLVSSFFVSLKTLEFMRARSRRERK